MSSQGIPGYMPSPPQSQYIPEEQAQLMQSLIQMHKRQQLAQLLRNSGVGQPVGDQMQPQGMDP